MREHLRHFKLALAALAALAAPDKKILGMAPHLLYEPLGQTLPGDARSASVRWALAQRSGVVLATALDSTRAHHTTSEFPMVQTLGPFAGPRVFLQMPKGTGESLRHLPVVTDFRPAVRSAHRRIPAADTVRAAAGTS